MSKSACFGSKAIYTWLANNQTKLNHDKFHLLLSTQGSTCIQIERFTIKYCQMETLVEINISNKLKFDIYVGIIGQKTNRKLNALRKITNKLCGASSKSCFYECIFSQYNELLLCYLEVSLFYNRFLNSKINGLFKQCRRIIHTHELLHFEELLNKYNSASNHHKSIYAFFMDI